MKTTVEILAEMLVELREENISLKEKVQKESDSSMYWFKAFNKLENEFKEFKTEIEK